MRGDTSFYHTPVMVEEVLRFLQVHPGGLYIDATAGEGGHSEAILRNCLPGGKVLGLDVDPQAVEAARARLEGFMAAVIVERESYANLAQAAARNGLQQVDGILLDLGIGSLQLDGSHRGFSFNSEDELDMRFNPDEELTAGEVVNRYSEKDLSRILREYGEEPRARSIARWIVRSRPINTASELADTVRRAYGGRRGRTDPATRTFQALRISVNREIDNLKEVLPQTIDLLRPGGRLAVIAYHSVEDRVVKEFIRAQSSLRGQIPTLRAITRKVVRPTVQETSSNPRARSARLRVAERLE